MWRPARSQCSPPKQTGAEHWSNHRFKVKATYSRPFNAQTGYVALSAGYAPIKWNRANMTIGKFSIIISMIA